MMKMGHLVFHHHQYPRPPHPILPQSAETKSKVACSPVSERGVNGLELPGWFFQGFVAFSWPQVLEFGEVKEAEEDFLGRERKTHRFPGDHE